MRMCEHRVARTSRRAVYLLSDDSRHAWITMPERIDSDAGAHVEVFSFLAIPNLAPCASHKDDRRPGVRREGVASMSSELFGDILWRRLIWMRWCEVSGVGLFSESVCSFLAARTNALKR